MSPVEDQATPDRKGGRVGQVALRPLGRGVARGIVPIPGGPGNSGIPRNNSLAL